MSFILPPHSAQYPQWINKCAQWHIRSVTIHAGVTPDEHPTTGKIL
jgi:hypothetical protein